MTCGSRDACWPHDEPTGKGRHRATALARLQPKSAGAPTDFSEVQCPAPTRLSPCSSSSGPSARRASRFTTTRIGICSLPQTLKQFQLQEDEGLRDRCFLKFVDPRFGHCSCRRCRKGSDYRTSVRIVRHRDNSLIRNVLRLLRSGDADAADVIPPRVRW